MNIEKLLKNNPWRGIADRFVDNEILYPQHAGAEFLCASDADMLHDFNEKADDSFRYHLNLPVAPWVGNPLTAKVIILSQNPETILPVDTFGNILRLIPQDMVSVFAEHQRDTLRLQARSLWPVTESTSVIPDVLANFHGAYYWWEVFNNPDAIGLDIPLDDIAIINYIGYNSSRNSNFFKNKKLKSQEYVKDLIEYIIENNPDTTFLVLHRPAEWKLMLGKLYDKKRFIDIHRIVKSVDSASPDDSTIEKIKAVSPGRKPSSARAARKIREKKAAAEAKTIATIASSHEKGRIDERNASETVLRQLGWDDAQIADLHARIDKLNRP